MAEQVLAPVLGMVLQTPAVVAPQPKFQVALRHLPPVEPTVEAWAEMQGRGDHPVLVARQAPG